MKNSIFSARNWQQRPVVEEVADNEQDKKARPVVERWSVQEAAKAFQDIPFDNSFTYGAAIGKLLLDKVQAECLRAQGAQAADRFWIDWRGIEAKEQKDVFFVLGIAEVIGTALAPHEFATSVCFVNASPTVFGAFSGGMRSAHNRKYWEQEKQRLQGRDSDIADRLPDSF